MEHQSRGGGADVERVAEDGAGEAVEAVHPELVRAACDWSEFETRDALVACEDSPACEGGLSEFVVDDLSRAIGWVEADGDVDLALGGGEWVGVSQIGGPCSDERDITLLDAAFFELAAEEAVRLRVKSEHEQPRGLHVEAVDGERAGGFGNERAEARGDAVLIGFAEAWD